MASKSLGRNQSVSLLLQQSCRCQRGMALQSSLERMGYLDAKQIYVLICVFSFFLPPPCPSPQSCPGHIPQCKFPGPFLLPLMQQITPANLQMQPRPSSLPLGSLAPLKWSLPTWARQTRDELPRKNVAHIWFPLFGPRANLTLARDKHPSERNFDHTKGFPGEGPPKRSCKNCPAPLKRSIKFNEEWVSCVCKENFSPASSAWVGGARAHQHCSSCADSKCNKAGTKVNEKPTPNPDDPCTNPEHALLAPPTSLASTHPIARDPANQISAPDTAEEADPDATLVCLPLVALPQPDCDDPAPPHPSMTDADPGCIWIRTSPPTRPQLRESCEQIVYPRKIGGDAIDATATCASPATPKRLKQISQDGNAPHPMNIPMCAKPGGSGQEKSSSPIHSYGSPTTPTESGYP